jgi:uroporphyrinogen-III synthase/uroporphyrinogen III methyltransferase/synthase
MIPRLDRRTVVVTRAAGGADGLADRLGELGAAVRELPAITFAPPSDPGPLDGALRELARFDWVVFASATAVDRVLERMSEQGIGADALAARSLAAVGPATADRLRSRLRAPDLQPPEATGEALARALAPSVQGRRVLLPRPSEGRAEILDGLASAAAELTAVEAYRTVPVPPERLAMLAPWIEQGEIDAVAFASPSAVRAVVAALGSAATLLDRVLVAAIGPTTLRALQEVGVRDAVVADRHTARDLAEVIAARLGPG